MNMKAFLTSTYVRGYVLIKYQNKNVINLEEAITLMDQL